MLIGSHVAMKGKKMLLGSVEEAASYQSSAFMIYTGAPQNTKRKPIDELRIPEARALMEKQGIEEIVIHAPYIVNLANPNKMENFEFYVHFLRDEIKRAEAIGAKQITFHPGSHVGTSVEAGIKTLIKGLNETLTGDEKAQIAIETMAGKGSEIGTSFEQIADIISGVTHNESLSVTMDTCHMNDAGYDVAHDFDGVLNTFDHIVGLDRLKVLHINDSKNEQGSHKDRHTNIGCGTIGFAALNAIVHHPQLTDIPKILETPWVQYDDNKRHKKPPYRFEIAMFRENQYNDHLLDDIKAQEDWVK
ncbi:MAG: deoxyribonuclease IV [Aerococcus sp.]|nr:deoxyribonuclease IV [Aerococcus sp.]